MAVYEAPENFLVEAIGAVGLQCELKAGSASAAMETVVIDAMTDAVETGLGSALLGVEVGVAADLPVAEMDDDVGPTVLERTAYGQPSPTAG